MRIRWLLSGGLALVFISLAAIWLVETPDLTVAPQQQIVPPEFPEAPELQWRVGNTQRYKILSDSSMQLNMDDSATVQSLKVQLDAFLDMQTLKSNEDSVLVGMRLSSVSLRISGNSDPQINKALTTAFRVKFTSKGYPTGFEFPAEVSSKNRSILENLVRMFQVTTAEGETWIAREGNGSGTYEAVYRRISATHLEKSKRHFKALSFVEMFDDAAIESTESIRLGTAYDWIVAMTVNEKLASAGRNGPAMTIHNQASLELLDSATVSIPDQLWRFTSTAAPEHETTAIQPEVKLSKEQAQARILSVVPELNAAEQGRTRWIHELRDLLRVDGALPAVILEILKTEELSDRTRADLYLALGLADTENAQRALITVFQQPDWAIQDALRAIVALGGVNTPSTDSLSALWETLYEVSSGGERQRLASTTTFALGRLGRTLNALENPEYISLRSGLLDGALSWGDDRQRVHFIHAVGNTGDATLTDEIAGLLNDDLPSVRRATAQSLGMLDIDRVANDLITSFKNEPDSQVRGAIAESLTNWSEPTTEANTIISTAVQSEQDVSARYNMARFLGVNLKTYPQNRPVLENLLRQEKNNRIRQMVANALAADT